MEEFKKETLPIIQNDIKHLHFTIAWILANRSQIQNEINTELEEENNVDDLVRINSNMWDIACDILENNGVLPINDNGDILSVEEDDNQITFYYQGSNDDEIKNISYQMDIAANIDSMDMIYSENTEIINILKKYNFKDIANY